ncbi:MGT family glycosyltransferase [Streptomyces sp. NBC_01275]|uniref:macrolide family glycosyltransferase n=1 Tax=Streptomyces sp. NBC_01275 TaxID=2903807 RepID=UPI0022596FFB|nr:macrolide family glycosyltransferase [Streptomyces sp. NBC_01275]MCX4760231.1 MGT family glycosyltransferase [Streptomyces sp. NBC_01275]
MSRVPSESAVPTLPATSSAKRHFAFFSTPAHGHVRPTLPIAAELVRRGHRVSYATTAQFHDDVAATGAEVLLYESTVEDLAKEVPADAEDWLALALTMAVAESSALVPVLRARFPATPPDVLAYDSAMNAAGRLLARQWDRPGVEMFPVFLPQGQGVKSFSLGKLVEGAEGGNGGGGPRPAMRAFHEAMSGFLAEHGAEDYSLREFAAGFGGTRLAFFPREFQQGGELFADHFAFVGPCLDFEAARGAWEPPTDGRRVVLVSLGTTYGNRPEFFRACVEAFADGPWHVVMTLGQNGVDPAVLEPLPANVEVHRWLPHLAVLPHAEAFVCQAGMGSLMEALACGTPLVLAAHGREQVIDAGRAVELGLGVMLAPGEPSAAEVHKAVSTAADSLEIRGRVAEMREHIRAAGGTLRAADVLERSATAG